MNAPPAVLSAVPVTARREWFSEKTNAEMLWVALSPLCEWNPIKKRLGRLQKEHYHGVAVLQLEGHGGLRVCLSCALSEELRGFDARPIPKVAR